ncbi:MAG: ATP-dependent Clp protease ATP-binding subunit, partial [Verrucomicrobiota bacterium]|nr:ATP-dependent Clp protease ATP-binding subunit [Verrucomicrobiota bacterium]
HSSFATMERHVLTRAQQSLRPELYARITEKLVFNRLSYDIQLDIAQLLLDEELQFLRARGHELTVASDVLSFVVRRGFHARLGARPMRNAVEKLVGDAVAERLLISAGTSGRLLVHDDAERLRIEATTEADEKA